MTPTYSRSLWPVRVPALFTFLASAILWLGGIWYFSRHNDFPVYYHPDEESKGRQIISGELNFHHPLLLLDTAGLWLKGSGAPHTVANAVVAGRWMSAVFSATSVLALALLAWRRAAWPGALLATILVPMHPLIYELAHYCKEDPALLMGMCLTLLMLDVFWSRPGPGTVAMLGAAAGLATSGKYLGVVMLGLALPLLWWRVRAEKGRVWKLTGILLGGWLGMVILVNLPYILEPAALKNGLSYELHAAALGGQKGLSRDVPHGKYLGVFLDNIGWPLWIGMGLFALRCALRKSERRAGDVVLLVFPLCYALLLSFSPKTASRYFLAVAPFLILAGSLGIIWLGGLLTRLPGRVNNVAVMLLAGLAIFGQWEILSPSLEGMRGDSRREMAEWMTKNLAPNSPLLAESRIHLSKAPTWPESKRGDLILKEEPFLPDLATLEEIRAQGYRYVAVIRTSFGGFLDRERKPVKSLQEQYQRRHQFYTRLFAEGKLLKKTGGGGVGILNPEVRLYDISVP